MARPSKFTDETAGVIVQELQAGATRAAAAERGGVDFETFRRWLHRFAGFSEQVHRAESEHAEASGKGGRMFKRKAPQADQVPALEPIDADLVKATMEAAMLACDEAAIVDTVILRMALPYINLAKTCRDLRDAEAEWRRRGAWVDGNYNTVSTELQQAEARLEAARREVVLKYGDPSMGWKKREVLQEAEIPDDLKRRCQLAHAQMQKVAGCAHGARIVAERSCEVIALMANGQEAAAASLADVLSRKLGEDGAVWWVIVGEEHRAGREVVLPAA